MSIQLTLTAFGDFSEVKVQQAILEARNQKIDEAIVEHDLRLKESFNNAMGVMRASYMMVSGFAQVMGTSMSQIFSSMYGAAVATIGTFTAIADAIAASGPWGWIQAGIMFAALMTALVGLGNMMDGQQKLGSQFSGLNMSMQGFLQLIASFNFS